MTPTGSIGLTCPNCGRGIKPKWRECPDCNTALGGHATPTAAGTGASGQPSSAGDDGIFVSMMDEGSSGTLGFGIDISINEGDVLDESDRYKVRKPLGVGGFGSVYAVHDSYIDEEMALKVVVAAEGEGRAQRAAEQILHEFKLRKRIDDTSHIIKAEDPRPCEYKNLSLILLPMELADGGSMRNWLSANKDVEKRRKQGLELFKQACLGVKALHDAGLVHLDIKPENILLVEGKAKITDFGIGRFAGSGFESNPNQLLRQGVGTPQYMSPEQFHTARQKDIGSVSDIYSLGLVLYEILDGSLPFDGSPTELREKHLHTPPKPLAGTVEKWWAVVARCLAKDPPKRYPDIERLIKDLDRTAQGAAVSVDVSCPKCGYINANPAARICEKCQVALDSLFRSCPVCARDVRLDIDNCPGCGAGVAAHYLLLHRKELVGKLKDEDPIEAIDILETILRDNAGNFQEQAVELIRELRQKQSQISVLIVSAGEQAAAGNTQDAIEAWRRVLKVIPRHRIAGDKIQELESLLKTYDDNRSKALDLMDKAEFKKADSLLQKCLEIIPASNEAKEELDNCRKRLGKYSAAFEKTKSLHKKKLLVEAADCIKVALAEAPKSSETIKLKNELAKIAQQTGNLLSKVRQQIKKAEFADAKNNISNIEELQVDLEGVDTIKADLPKTRKSYNRAFEDAESAQKAGDLSKAAGDVKKALKLCPDSGTAKSLSGKINNDREKAKLFVEAANDCMDTAQFNDSDRKLQEAKAIWPNIKGLDKTKQKLSETREKYTSHIETARQFQSDKDLQNALDTVNRALALCPDSQEAASLVDSIQNSQSKAKEYETQAEEYCNSAEFEKAREQLQKAKAIWPLLKDYQNAESEINETEASYNKEFSLAKDAFAEEVFDKAKAACGRALKLCCDSSGVKELSNRITQRQKEKENAQKRLKEIAVATGKYAVIIAPGVIGAILLFSQSLLLGLIVIGLCIVATLLNYLLETEIYEALDEWDFLKYDYQPAFAMTSGLIVISGVLASLTIPLVSFAFPILALVYLFFGKKDIGEAGKWIGTILVGGAAFVALVFGVIWFLRWLCYTVWPLCVHGKLYIGIAGAIIAVLGALIHAARYSNFYRNLAKANGDSPSAVFCVVFAMIACCAIPGVAIGLLSKYIFGGSTNIALTVGVIVSMVTAVLATLYSLVSAKDYERI